MQTETDYASMDTPEFKARADALIKTEQAKFDAWMVEEKFEEFIASAKAEARAAYKEAAHLPEVTDQRSTWLEIDMGHRRANHLVPELAQAGIGYFEPAAWSWFINSDHVIGKQRRGHYGTRRQYNAAMDAFAMAISRPGFELKITHDD